MDLTQYIGKTITIHASGYPLENVTVIARTASASRTPDASGEWVHYERKNGDYGWIRLSDIRKIA